jgi:hypothetical protein
MAGNAEQNKDFQAHHSTYGGFLGLVKWGTVATCLVAAFVIWLIA